MACFDATNMIYTVFSRYIAATRDRQQQYIENGTRFFVLFAIYSTNFFLKAPKHLSRTQEKHYAPSLGKAFRKRP